jgi:hypothetical protein
MSDRSPLEFYVRQLAAVLLFVLSAVSASRTKETTWGFLAVLFAANLLSDKTDFPTALHWALALCALFLGLAVFLATAIRADTAGRWVEAGMAAGLAVEALVMITRRARGV